MEVDQTFNADDIHKGLQALRYYPAIPIEEHTKEMTDQQRVDRYNDLRGF